jgi:hypothetical protein
MMIILELPCPLRGAAQDSGNAVKRTKTVRLNTPSAKKQKENDPAWDTL